MFLRLSKHAVGRHAYPLTSQEKKPQRPGIEDFSTTHKAATSWRSIFRRKTMTLPLPSFNIDPL